METLTTESLSIYGACMDGLKIGFGALIVSILVLNVIGWVRRA